MGPLNAGSGSKRARSNSIPARPYICRFSILRRLSCPSTGPLLHGSLTAASTALRSCFKVRTKRTSEWIPVLRAASIQRWRVVAGQPTQKIIERRRSAKFITPIPKPKKRKTAAQPGLVFDEGLGLSTKAQAYDPTSIINEVRGYVDRWRSLRPNQWQVTPETARLLEHWRHHEFSDVRPFSVRRRRLKPKYG